MHHSKLLVSVRDESEAEAALRGGADLIDVKEPTRGSLGKADDDVIRAIALRAAGQAPVSAALGEWEENATWPPDVRLSFVKWGPAGAGRKMTAWKQFLGSCLDWKEAPQPVLVAYADWVCAQAPPVEEIVALACQRMGSVLLIDTHCKDTPGSSHRTTLLDWLPLSSVQEICRSCRRAEVRVALAGSIGLDEIRHLALARPDWFAVRGAACEQGDRTSSVSAEQVRTLAAEIRTHNQ